MGPVTTASISPAKASLTASSKAFCATRALAGVGVMFVLNLSVSFLLSLANAARAYDLPRRDLTELLRRIVRRFVRSPGQFLLPPRAEVEAA